jgi:hypothetical protein
MFVFAFDPLHRLCFAPRVNSLKTLLLLLLLLVTGGV